MPRNTAVTSPSLGLIFDRPPVNIPSRALRDGINFRCKNGTLESRNLGWERFSLNFTLNGPVLLIDNFFPRGLAEQLIFGTATDLYLYVPGSPDSVVFLTPRYETGTASASGTAVTGTGTDWDPNAKPGDEITFGTAGVTDPDATWFVIDTVNSDTSITLTTSAGTVGNGPYTIRKKFTMIVGDYWSFDTFVFGTATSDLWFATNGRDDIVTWDGVATQVTLHPELGFTCKTLATYSNMMIYGNIVQAGVILHSSIINSDVALPLNAGATGTGLSEQFVTYNGTDEILNMISLGDYLVIYAERTIIPTQFIGDPLIFLFRVGISGVGPISPNALADFGDFHEFLGADAGYVFDGVTLKETNSHVWRDILRQADPIRRRQVYGHFDEEQGDLIWSIPSNSDAGVGTEGQPPETAWSEHYLEEVGDQLDGSPFSKRDFPFTITGFYQREAGLTWAEILETWEEFNFAWNDQFFQAAFPLNLAGSFDGNIWILNQIQTANGAVLPSFVRTGRMITGSGRERNLLTRIYPFAHSSPFNLEVDLFMGDHVAGEPNSKGQQLFNMNLIEGGHFVTFYRRGRTMEFQFGSSNGNPWTLDGWDYDLKTGGRR